MTISQQKSTNNSSSSSSSSREQQQKQQPNDLPKKKKPIQHLIGGGIAGFVESSVCHPLDTIKTRMQLRRQITAKSEIVKRMEGKALGSMRDATASSLTGGLTGKSVVGGSAGGDRSKEVSHGRETVRVKPNLAKVASSSPSAGAPSVLHDVGWKQRLPPSSSMGATTTATVASASSTSIKSAVAAETSTSGTVVATLGPFGTARRIVQREGPLALYKGLTAVYTGIIPKMAIRFVSFEWYRDTLGGWYSQYAGLPASAPPTPTVTFTAGLLSGLTEAVLIVTPAEVCKIRMQSQYHSLMDPTQRQHAKYRNVVQTAGLIVKEEGIGALYKGVVPTMLRQGCNQAVNFTVYNWSKKVVLSWKKSRVEQSGGDARGVQLDHWQSLVLGGLSGGMGPLVNNPLDVVKTRMQKQVIHPGKEPKYKSLTQSCVVIAKEEGVKALWKGITPRLLRIMPGQAITFMTYEAVSARMEKLGWFD
ncbi:hypothetical protein HJC23_000799 [Cyclotella cryptica]|uniref:Mitochondrial carrier protein n=1 Tax=Cyclotella cryptica TaxID=29204 RepID=A0ABD3Q791_9STRA|eukprot:CCRYP_008422-RC/>CCRYP_008422-RC protein AED:0.09 eAED:0.09 QI:583/1/1/1/0.5/0.4/5/171/475